MTHCNGDTPTLKECFDLYPAYTCPFYFLSYSSSRNCVGQDCGKCPYRNELRPGMCLFRPMFHDEYEGYLSYLLRRRAYDTP